MPIKPSHRPPQPHHVPPLLVPATGDPAIRILDRICIHARARVPALRNMTLDELAVLFGDLQHEIDRILEAGEERSSCD